MILFQDDQGAYRRLLKIDGQVVGVAQVAVPHGLGTVPQAVVIELTSNGVVWQSQAADATNVYLTAGAANTTCNVRVLG